MKYLTHDLILHLIFFQMISLGVILTNFRLIHRSRQANRQPANPDYPTVSILVPARNEEASLAACLRSLLNQNYPHYEVLVLDDQSDDQTPQIMAQLSRQYPHLKCFTGQPAPAAIAGKNWACAQLARQAQGEILVFTDADTLHSPAMLAEVVTVLTSETADLVSGYPRQVVGTWGERLLVPFFSWAMYTFIPLGLAYRWGHPALASAVGQLLVFRRAAYTAIGGHAALGPEIVDDLGLARKIAAAGLRWRVTYAADLISCRMYRLGRAAVAGFTKNLFAAFEFRLLPFVFLFGWLGVMFWLPAGVLILWLAGLAPQADGVHLLTCLGLNLLIWALPYRDLKIPGWLALIYPLTVFANSLVAFRSVQASLNGQLTWKGRRVSGGRLRWF